MTSENKSFSMSYLTCDFKERVALILMVCYVTNEVNKKRTPDKKVSCKDVLFKIVPPVKENLYTDFLIELGDMCDDFMYGCKTFDNFGIDPKTMVKQIRNILDTFLPF